METLLFIPLGTREITLTGLEDIKEKITDKTWKELTEEIKYPENDKNFRNLNVRKFGHWLTQNFEVIKDNIDIQIIEPFLKWLKEQNKNIGKIYLIATNQKEEKDQEYIKRDTYTIAKFLKDTFFPFYFQNKEYNYLPEVEIIELNDKPNDYDSMIKEIGESLMKVPEKNNINQYEVYAEITGGTPQINTALMLNCIKYFRKKVKFIYKSESTTEIKSLEIGKYILKNYEHEALQRLVERYDFDAISKNENYPEIIRKLAECACYRMNFDFEGYLQEIDGIEKFLPNEIKKSYKNKIIELKKTVQEFYKTIDPNKILNELFWNAYIMWERDECANFLGRVWRILEVVNQYSIRRYIVCKWRDIYENNFAKQFQSWVQKNPKFIEHMEEIGLNIYTYNRKNLKEAVVFLANEKKDDKLKKISEINERLDELSNLRNSSIIAHGFEGISKKKIQEIISEYDENVIDLLKKLLEAAEIHIKGTNPFDIFKEIIISINEFELNRTLNI